MSNLDYLDRFDDETDDEYTTRLLEALSGRRFDASTNYHEWVSPVRPYFNESDEAYAQRMQMRDHHLRFRQHIEAPGMKLKIVALGLFLLLGVIATIILIAR